MKPWYAIAMFVGVGLVAAWFAWVVGKPVVFDTQEPVVDTVEVEYVTMELPEYNMSFAYRSNPNPYIVRTHAPEEGETTTLEMRYEILLDSDYVELLSSDIPREPSPMMVLSVFANPTGLESEDQGTAQFNLIRNDIVVTEPESVEIGGLLGVAYEADGLYLADIVWLYADDYWYRFEGQFLDRDSEIRDDFTELLASFVYTGGSD